MKWLLVVWVLAGDYGGSVQWQVKSIELMTEAECIHHRRKLERLYQWHNTNPKHRTQKVECVTDNKESL